MDAREALEKVLGLQQNFVVNGKLCGRFIPVAGVEALLKGLTEAGEARRVMLCPSPEFEFKLRVHYENDRCGSYGCTVAPDTEETRAWVARQRKDSHAG